MFYIQILILSASGLGYRLRWWTLNRDEYTEEAAKAAREEAIRTLNVLNGMIPGIITLADLCGEDEDDDEEYAAIYAVTAELREGYIYT